MSTIPDGYKLLVIDSNGELILEEELGGYDLSKGFAQSWIIASVVDEIALHESNTYAD